MDVVELNNYDMSRVISRAKKEFGFIVRGTEDDYNPQLDYLEHAIYNIYTEININDRELLEIIEMIIYDLKGIIENKEYNYKHIRENKQILFAKKLQELFNPFVNDDIKITDKAKNDLKSLFSFPIKCLLRIYDSIKFWNQVKGKDGYFQMLEEMVLPIIHVGPQPFALENKYVIKINS